MSLVWHIAKKDLRRMGLPVAVWLGLVLWPAWQVRTAAVSDAVVRASGVTGWIEGVQTTTILLGVMQMALMGVLAAFLFQEDPSIGTDATWLTRPIARWRMLAAKMVGGAVMFVVAPLVLMLPIWVSYGFSLSELSRAMMLLVLWQGALVVVAGSIAALTSDLGKFIFALLGVGIWLGVFGLYGLTRGAATEQAAAVQQTRLVLVWVLTGGALVVAGAAQILSRRTRWVRAVVVAGAVLTIAVRVMWPWNLTEAWPGHLVRWENAAARSGADVTVEKIVVPNDRNLPYATFLKIPAGPVAGEFVAPYNGTGTVRCADGQTAPVAFEKGGLWGDDATKRLLGLASASGPVSWGLATTAKGATPPNEPGAETTVTGILRMARTRAQVRAEVPWRAGVSGQTGSSFLRIVSVGQLPGSMSFGVVIEEREPALGLGVDPTRRDCFALVNRRLGIFKSLHIVETGSLVGNAVRLVERTLDYEPPRHVVDGKRVEVDGWERDAVLVKVSFETIERWETQVTTERVSIVGEEKKL